MPTNTSKGPSSSATSYIINNEPNVSIQAVLTTGDVIGTKTFGGTPDGIGAFDNGDGTITILLNHEITINGTGTNPASSTRDHGGKGSWVDAIVMDKTTHAVTSLSDLGKVMHLDNAGSGTWTVGTTDISRLCSADLADASAFFNEATGMGTTARIFLNGEEQGIGNGTPTAGGGAYDSRAFAWIATGTDKGSIYELPGMGNTSFENLVANPWTGDKTAVMIDNDTSPAGQVFIYLGDKTNTGNDVQKAGLVGGTLYGVVAAGIGAANNSSTTSGREAAETSPPTSGNFTMAAMTDAVHTTGTQLQTLANNAGVSGWWRPEDGAWDPTHHNVYYFNTTASNTGITRVWSLTFSDLNHLENGGTFKMVFQGTPGINEMFDNMTVSSNGHILINEDPGNYKGPSKLWDLDPTTGEIHQIGALDPALFGNGNGETNAGNGTIVTANPQTGFSLDKETSGILDVTSLLGTGNGDRVYLTDVQNHAVTGNTLTVEGGQLDILTVAAPTITHGNDMVNGSYAADNLNARSGDDTMNGGSGNDTLFGGTGNDVMNGDAGNDSLNGGAGTDTLNGGDGNDMLNGGTENDMLAGGAGLDTLLGGAGDDNLDGGAGNDSLNGGLGNDTLTGGLGTDSLMGGAGSDVFHYNTAAEGGDQITGFAVGDSFEISAAGFAGGLVADAAVDLVQGAAATASHGQFLFDKSTGNLSWDVDGSGASAAVVLAHFNGHVTLHASDFHVVG